MHRNGTAQLVSGALDGRVAVHDLSAYASTENPTKGTLRAAVCDFERPILNVSCTISSAGTVQSLVTIDNRGKLQASRLSRPFIDRVKSTLSGPWPALLSLEEGSTKLSVVELRPESFARNRVEIQVMHSCALHSHHVESIYILPPRRHL